MIFVDSNIPMYPVGTGCGGRSDQVDLTDVERAKTILMGHVTVSFGHALHLAVIERHGVPTVLSFDRGFDDYPGIRRLS